MRTQHAVRNIRLCTKDCLCLYVCPVGATDTENGQVDWDKCIGCGKCAASCPSGAISMVPDVMPPQQKKDEKVVWECDICGYQVEANNAPSICPVCGQNHAHFAIDEKNY